MSWPNQPHQGGQKPWLSMPWRSTQQANPPVPSGWQQPGGQQHGGQGNNGQQYGVPPASGQQSGVSWFGGFSRAKVPPQYEPGLQKLDQPHGEAKPWVGEVKNCKIQSRRGNPVHQSHYNPADKAQIISVLVEGVKSSRMAHVYPGGKVTFKPDWSKQAQVNPDGTVRMRPGRNQDPPRQPRFPQ